LKVYKVVIVKILHFYLVTLDFMDFLVRLA